MTTWTDDQLAAGTPCGGGPVPVNADPWDWAYVIAKNRYLVEHPEAAVTDFRCTVCHAEPGQPCTWRIRAGWRTPEDPNPVHLARWRPWARAARRRRLAAYKHADQVMKNWKPS